MADVVEPKGLTVLLKTRTSLPGETAVDFMKQYKALTEQDKEDLRAAFEAEGTPVKA